MSCQARQYNDQMSCGKCGLAWDVNDPEPPKCGTKRRKPPKERAILVATRVIDLPEELPDDVALEMVTAFYNSAATHGNCVAIQTAYRVLLDRLADLSA